MAIWSHLIADVHWTQLKISVALPTQEVCYVTDFYRCDLQSLVVPAKARAQVAPCLIGPFIPLALTICKCLHLARKTFELERIMNSSNTFLI